MQVVTDETGTARSSRKAIIMALQKTATKWILVWIALLLLAAPGQALSAVPQAKGNPIANAEAEKAALTGNQAEFLLASRGGVNRNREEFRRTHQRKLRQPKRTSRRDNLSSPSTLRKWEHSERTRPTHERTNTMGSEVHRDSHRFERIPRHQGHEYFTPSSKESAWDKK